MHIRQGNSGECEYVLILISYVDKLLRIGLLWEQGGGLLKVREGTGNKL